MGESCRLNWVANSGLSGFWWLADVDAARRLHSYGVVPKGRFLLWLAAWIVAYAATAMLWPVYLIPFGALGSILALLAIGILIVAGAAIVIVGWHRVDGSRRRARNLLGYVVLPLLVMSSFAVFLTLPLMELSHLLLYGPRPLPS